MEGDPVPGPSALVPDALITGATFHILRRLRRIFHQLMTPDPDRVFPEDELRRHTGDRGTRIYVACGGVVYDVTDCPKWRTGLHELLHFAGQDLTSEFPDAPHGAEVFRHPCVKQIGRLISN